MGTSYYLLSENLIDYLFNDLREILHFELVLLLSNVVDSILGGKCHTVLGYNLARITDRRDIVDGHARLRLSCSLNSFVDMMPPHALSSILW